MISRDQKEMELPKRTIAVLGTTDSMDKINNRMLMAMNNNVDSNELKSDPNVIQSICGQTNTMGNGKNAILLNVRGDPNGSACDHKTVWNQYEQLMFLSLIFVDLQKLVPLLRIEKLIKNALV